MIEREHETIPDAQNAECFGPMGSREPRRAPAYSVRNARCIAQAKPWGDHIFQCLRRVTQCAIDTLAELAGEPPLRCCRVFRVRHELG